jgi:hypothetical protein
VLHEAGSQGLASVHASLNADICQLYQFEPHLHLSFRVTSQLLLKIDYARLPDSDNDG